MPDPAVALVDLDHRVGAAGEDEGTGMGGEGLHGLAEGHRDDDAHAVSIAADISERTGRVVRRAAVYTTLQLLEEKGLLATALGEPRAERGGKPRRNVTPTRDGIAAVRTTMHGIHAMTRGVKI